MANDEIDSIDCAAKALLALSGHVAKRLFPRSKLGPVPISPAGIELSDEEWSPLSPAARKPPAKEWIPSHQQELPIDHSLSELRKRKLLRAYDGHVVARRWIELAELHARMDLEARRFHDQSRGAVLQNSKDAAQKLLDGIAEFLDADRDWALAPGFGYRAKRMDYSKHSEAGRAIHAALAAIATARTAAETLRDLAIAERNRRIPPNASGDVWRKGFVATLCFGWRDLTGQNPTADSTHFRRFVDDCYLSLAGNEFTASCGPDNELPKFKSWIGPIRTVVRDFEARPAWDGFDRYERDLQPPGARFTIDNETLAARQARDAAKADAEAAALLADPAVREFFDIVEPIRKHKKAPK